MRVKPQRLPEVEGCEGIPGRRRNVCYRRVRIGAFALRVYAHNRAFMGPLSPIWAQLGPHVPSSKGILTLNLYLRV